MMLDDEEAVQHTETQRGHSEKVEDSATRWVPKPPIRGPAVPRWCEVHPRMDSRTLCLAESPRRRWGD
jgi:hypothetical protein